MKKTIGLLLCFITLLFGACKKNSTSAPTVTTTRVATVYDDSSHISTLRYYTPAQLFKGSYDDSGRYSYACHYLDGQSITDVQVYGLPSYSVYYIWNNQSFVDTSNILSSSGEVGIRKNYTYNASGYLTQVNWYNQLNALVLTESFSVSNGDITQHTYNILDTTNASLPHGSYTYQYYSGMANTLSNLYFGQNYLGLSSKDAVKSVTYTYGSTTSITDYTYHYSNGLISSQLVFTDSSGSPGVRVDSIAYSYYIQ